MWTKPFSRRVRIHLLEVELITNIATAAELERDLKILRAEYDNNRNRAARYNGHRREGSSTKKKWSCVRVAPGEKSVDGQTQEQPTVTENATVPPKPEQAKTWADLAKQKFVPRTPCFMLICRY